MLVELNFDNQQLGDEFQAQAAMFVKDRLLPLVEQLFDQQSHANEVISIDTLELDLGDISQQDYLMELESQLKQQLLQKLNQLIPAARSTTAENTRHLEQAKIGIEQLVSVLPQSTPTGENVKIVSKQDGLLQQLEYYLHHGVMPWNVDNEHFNARHKMKCDSSSSWLDDMVEHNLSWLVNLLSRPSARRHVMLTRLFYQLSPEILQQLVLRLSIEQQIHLVELLQQQPGSRHSHVLKVYRDAYLQQKIVQGLLSGAANILLPCWSQIIISDRKLLTTAIRLYGQQANVRHRIVRGFTDQMLLDLVALLEPQEYRFIYQLLKHAELFEQSRLLTSQAKVKSTANKHKATSGLAHVQSKQQLWHFTFDYLLVERGSQFNRKSYLASVISKMAAYYNVGQQQLLSSLQEILVSAVSLPNSSSELSTAMLQMLEDIGQILPASQRQIGTSDNNNAWHEPLTAQHVKSHKPWQQRVLELLLARAIIDGAAEPILAQWPLIVDRRSNLLAQLLRLHGQAASSPRNMVKGFTIGMLKDIIMVLEPVEHRLIQQLIENSELVFSASKKIASKKVPPKQHQSILWEFTLGYLLVERGSIFNKTNYLASVLTKMAAHDNIHYPQLLIALYQQVTHFTGSTQLQQQLIKLLHGLGELAGIDLSSDERKIKQQPLQAQFTARLIPKLVSTERLATHSRVNYLSKSAIKAAVSMAQEFEEQDLLKHIVNAIIHGDQQSIARYWQQLNGTYRHLFIELLNYHGQLALVRSKLATGFKPSQLQQIIQLIEPTAKHFVMTMFDDISLFNATSNAQHGELPAQNNQIDSPRRHVKVNSQVLSHSLWEFTLNYMMVERGSRFNKLSYLASVIRQMAAHRNMNYQTLASAMLQAVSASSYRGEIAELLTQLVTGEAEQKSTQQQDNQQLLVVYDDYLGVVDYLTGNKSVSASSAAADFSRCLTQLSQQSPLLLRRILIASQANKINWQQVVLLLNEQQLKQLISAFLSLNYTVGSASKSNVKQFMQALSLKITAWSQGHKTQHFFAMVLTAIAAGQAIDFEKIGQDIERLKPVTNKTPIIDQPIESSEPSSYVADGARVQTSEQYIRHYFEREHSCQVDAGQSPLKLTKLITAIEHMLANNRHALATLLRTGLRSIWLTNYVSQHLPERLLMQILLLLQPNDYRALQDYARMTVDACYQHGELGRVLLGAGLNLEQLQYHYILQYLIVEGRCFNAQDFISRFINYLSGYLSNNDNGVIKERALASYVASQLRLSNLAAEQTTKDKIISVIDADIERSKQHSEPLEPSVIQQGIKLMNIKDKSVLLKTSATPLDNAENEIVPQVKADDAAWLHGENDDIAATQGNEISIGNAGLVLLSPYIPRLFIMLDLVSDGQFKQPKDAVHAMHLLQYVVNGSSETPEYELALNKVLCGININQPVAALAEISEEEKKVVYSMLNTVIQHWSSLGGTSVSGLQETFIERTGVLQFNDKKWQLNIEQSQFDMLLDSLPWDYTLIKHPWMEQPLHVQWR